MYTDADEIHTHVCFHHKTNTYKLNLFQNELSPLPRLASQPFGPNIHSFPFAERKAIFREKFKKKKCENITKKTGAEVIYFPYKRRRWRSLHKKSLPAWENRPSG